MFYSISVTFKNTTGKNQTIILPEIFSNKLETIKVCNKINSYFKWYKNDLEPKLYELNRLAGIQFISDEIKLKKEIKRLNLLKKYPNWNIDVKKYNIIKLINCKFWQKIKLDNDLFINCIWNNTFNKFIKTKIILCKFPKKNMEEKDLKNCNKGIRELVVGILER